MERFKMPAGKLATVFFSTDIVTPRCTSDVESQQSGSSDGEKEDDGQSNSAQETSIFPQSHHAEIVKTQQAFSWKNLCIDVKTADGTKRLLDNVSGQSTTNPKGTCNGLLTFNQATSNPVP